MLRGFFGNLIFAIIAQMLCGNHLNCSFSSGLVPNKLIINRIIPLHKSGSETLVSNYRPITLLSIFHKITEKLRDKRLINFLDNHSILNENQFGLRSGRSTTQATMLITDKMQ